jgi:kumamolisin
MAMIPSISPKTLSTLYAFPEGATGTGHRVVLLEFGGGFHKADLEQHLKGLGLTPAAVGPLTAVEVGAVNSPLRREKLQSVARDFGRDDASFDRLEAAHGEFFTQFLETLEVTADIQTVRAFAPGAEIVVLFAQLGPSAGSVIQFALDHHDPTVIATSWGTSEWRRSFIEVCAVERALENAKDKGVTVCCAAGDFGSRNDSPHDVRSLENTPKGKTRVNWPASCSFALACGGSQVELENGVRRGEIVWETDFGGIRRATGGGMSGRYARPEWQPQRDSPLGVWTKTGLDFDGRWMPDVAAHAARTYEVVVGGEKVLADGTSIAAPLWASLLACVSEKLGRKVGWINERLYQLTPDQRAQAFYDVTQGANTMKDVSTDATSDHFKAGAGWDPCTGFGSPNGVELLKLLR